MYKIEEIDNIPILLFDKINFDNPFAVVEIFRINDNLQLKIRYIDKDYDVTKLKYSILKNIIKNPMLIVNESLSLIIENNEIKNMIGSFYHLSGWYWGGNKCIGVLSVNPIVVCGCEINIIKRSINDFNIFTFI